MTVALSPLSNSRSSVRKVISNPSLNEPGCREKTRAASDPSGANPNAAAMERRFQLKRCVGIGVFPFGAQVALTEGRSEKPDSSSKMIHAPRHRAFFLPRANDRAPRQ